MKKIKAAFISLLCILMLTGCGSEKSKAIEEYQTNMATFFNHLSEYHNNINDIDVEQEGYVTKLLTYLDDLEAEVAWMAGLEVPKEFSAAESLADEASENMAQAVALFHAAYEGEEFDENSEQAAREYYARANVRIQYIVTILHGEIPEGEGVTYTEEDSIFGEGYLNKEKKEESAEEESLPAEDNTNEAGEIQGNE